MADYCNISIPEVFELDVFTYWAIIRDLVIYNHSHTKEGRKWLKNAYRLTQTVPETEKLHKKAGKGGATRHVSKKH